jgi:hypothetical protein
MEKYQANNHPSSVEKTNTINRKISARFFIYTLLVLVLVILGMYLWKVLAVRSLDKKMDLQRTEMIQKQQMALDIQARDMLRLSALPLAWAVRTEMMRENLSQVDDYFRDFVREEGVLSIFLIDKENKVVLATNRKLETQSAGQVVSQTIRDAKDIVIENTGSGLRLGVPIMGFKEKMGLLVVDYQTQNFPKPETPQ